MRAAFAARQQLLTGAHLTEDKDEGPTRRKLVLTPDGRGVLIFGRDPNDPDSSWRYRPDSGIDFFAVEGLVQKEANHMDIDLGLPISWPIWQDDADEYAKSPEAYRTKRQRESRP